MSAIPVPLPGPDRQLNLDFDGAPLVETTFCVVDLETTGGSPGDGRITEIGAVKVRGGEVLGEFRTFVNPGSPIPAFITVLTGITQQMVADAPTEFAAVPMLLEFLHGSVFVAHNAPYDTSFLKAACERISVPWPHPQVVDTARLSRATLGRDEVPNHKLATLAQFFRTKVTPSHRALDDARATVDVLHGLLERLGTTGVLTLEELATATRKVPQARREKRHLADRLPEAAGVYTFRDDDGRPLYVGVSQDIRRRVRSYFTSAEQRPRMTEMVGIATSVTAIVCATDLEARVRELRLIAEWKPPYNRRSRHPERNTWLKLTDEPYPRLSLVRAIGTDDDACRYIGPFGSRGEAELAVAAINDATGLRACTQRLKPGRATPGCVLGELGKCGAPCSGEVPMADYQRLVDRAWHVMAGDPGPVERALTARMGELADHERFEQAAQWRDRLTAAVRGIRSAAELRTLGQLPQIVAATSRPGGWDIHVVRHGRMAAAAFCPAGADAHRAVEAAMQTAEHVERPHPPGTAALVAESRLLMGWLERSRLVHLEGTWALPVTPR